MTTSSTSGYDSRKQRRSYNSLFGRRTVEELRRDFRAVLMNHHWD
jgi:hypothetical protein